MRGGGAPCGLYGKTPAAGDFLRLNLPAATAQALDVWLEAGFSHLAIGGEDWRDGFSEAPAWRFVAAAGAVGTSAFAGVLLPSRDQVGRLFPCIGLAALDGLEATGAVACTPWFDRLERLLRRALEGAAPDGLPAELAELAAPESDDLDVLSLRARSTDDGLFLDVRSGPDGRAVTLQAVLETSPLASGASLWWRHTGAGAKVMMTPGLPRRDAFAALFQPAGDGASPAGAAPPLPSLGAVS